MVPETVLSDGPWSRVDGPDFPKMADRSTDRPSTSSPAGTARQVMAKQLRKPVELVLPVDLGFLRLIVKQFS